MKKFSVFNYVSYKTPSTIQDQGLDLGGGRGDRRGHLLKMISVFFISLLLIQSLRSIWPAISELLLIIVESYGT